MELHGLGRAKPDSDLGVNTLNAVFHALGSNYRRFIHYVHFGTPIIDQNRGIDSQREWGTRSGRGDERAASTRGGLNKIERRYKQFPRLEAANPVEYSPRSGAIRRDRFPSLHDDVV